MTFIRVSVLLEGSILSRCMYIRVLFCIQDHRMHAHNAGWPVWRLTLSHDYWAMGRTRLRNVCMRTSSGMWLTTARYDRPLIHVMPFMRSTGAGGMGLRPTPWWVFFGILCYNPGGGCSCTATGCPRALAAVCTSCAGGGTIMC